MSNFNSAITYVIRNEGGFVNDPLDPGGATCWGITLDDLSIYRGTTATVEDVKALEYFDACKIYKQFYWDKLGLDALPGLDGIATAILDVAVNRGLKTAVKYVQECCRIPDDGIFGAKTFSALQIIPPNTFLCRFVSLVQAGYVELVVLEPSRLHFLPGWTARANRLLTLMEGITL